MSTKLKHLEGLRGLAAMAVVFHHLKLLCFVHEYNYFQDIIRASFLPKWIQTGCLNIINLSIDGSLAVYIFWVLSSYVISIKLFKQNENYDQLIIAYFSKRYFRLFFPVLISILFSYALLESGCIFSSKLGKVNQNNWLSNFYGFKANIWEAIKTAYYESFFNFKTNSTYNAVVWTIQREFLGSLFTFSIFGIIRHNGLRFYIYLVILLVLLKLELYWLSAFLFGHILSDFDTSERGIPIPTILKRFSDYFSKLKFLHSILGLLIIVYAYPTLSAMKIPVAYHHLILSVVIVLFCLKINYFRKLFSTKIPFILGQNSFGLYLIHLPFLCSFTCYLLLIKASLQYKLFVACITILLLLMLSYLFTRFIDKYSIVYANKIGDFVRKYTR